MCPRLKASIFRRCGKNIGRSATSASSSDGQKQYVQPVDDFAAVYEADPYTPFAPRDAVSEDIDVAILGGGWSGILAGYHLSKAGVTNFRNIDHAGDFGGVWYWNRYPGLQCDNDAYCYLPLLEEMGFMPSKKFAYGHEIRDHAQGIARKFDLYEKALFHTTITSLRWDEAISRWRVGTDRGDDIRARFVIMANGLLNIPKLPGIPGIHDFKGKMFHTARWDYDYTGGDQKNPVLTSSPTSAWRSSAPARRRCRRSPTLAACQAALCAAAHAIDSR